MKRRDFIATSLATVILPKPEYIFPNSISGMQISVFSKTLHWISNYDILANTVAEMGFDGIDLTVRPDGHVLPEKVAIDLPTAVKAAQRAKIEIPMMVTNILEANALSETILKTANSQNIKHYRMGWYRYDMKKDIPEQIETFTHKMKAVSELNKKYTITGEYQNHGGQYLGAAIWDLYPILKKINSPFMGAQFDVNHATAESGSNWETSFRLIAPFIKSLPIKDFKWVLENGTLQKEGCPIGEGIVDWKLFFQLVKQYNIKVPLTMHFEYNLGGAENGDRNPKIDTKEITIAMKRDLALLKTWLKEAGL